jgi:hypothetical protein
MDPDCQLELKGWAMVTVFPEILVICREKLS